MTKPRTGARLRAGDVLEIDCGEKVAFLCYLGKHHLLGDAIWVVPRVFDAGTEPCGVVRNDGYVTFYPATAALRSNVARRVGYCTDGLRLLPNAVRNIGLRRPDGTVSSWLIEDGSSTRTPVTELTPEQRALPVASIKSHPALVERILTGWTPAQLERPSE